MAYSSADILHIIRRYRIMENSLFKSVYNPDVLSCIANLSNDEVFTPPELANKIIDMLPQELFKNPDTTFLDPCCKSGVFLREIAKRLIKGLEQQIPDLEKRIEHIFSKQLFGIAITELTSLLSRRSVYCTVSIAASSQAVSFLPISSPKTNRREISFTNASSILGKMANVSIAVLRRVSTTVGQTLKPTLTNLSTI